VTLRKVGCDVNVPHRAVTMLNSGFGDQGYEFIWEPAFASPDAEDEHWAMAFKRFGGEVVITGDKNIAKRLHQILAFKDNNLICFFCKNAWASQDPVFKCAHLLMWWPRIQATLQSAKPKDCWWIPMGLRAGLPLEEVRIPNDARQKAAVRRTA
jgi:hypothetical protein